MPSLRSVLACGYHSSLARTGMKALLAAVLMSSQVSAQDRDVQTIWRLLDYIAVDYAAAITDGHVVSQAEYNEMVEFSGQVETRLGSLPDKSINRLTAHPWCRREALLECYHGLQCRRIATAKACELAHIPGERRKRQRGEHDRDAA